MRPYPFIFFTLLLSTYCSLSVSTSECVRRAAALAGTLKRGVISEAFVPRDRKKIKLALFDADNSVRINNKEERVASRPEDVMILPGASEKMQELVDQGYFVALITNQGGIGKHTTTERTEATLAHTASLLGGVHYYDYCDSMDVMNQYRKPNTGMIRSIVRKLKAKYGDDVEIDWEGSVMVGDAAYTKSETRPDGTPGTDWTNSDRLLAENMRKELHNPNALPFHEPDTFLGWRALGYRRFQNAAQVEDALKKQPK